MAQSHGTLKHLTFGMSGVFFYVWNVQTDIWTPSTSERISDGFGNRGVPVRTGSGNQGSSRSTPGPPQPPQKGGSLDGLSDLGPSFPTAEATTGCFNLVMSFEPENRSQKCHSVRPFLGNHTFPVLSYTFSAKLCFK